MTYKRFRHALPAALRDRCLYCGDPASCRDHALPWAAEESPWVVPACSSCNGILGARRFPTLGERAGHVARKLEDRLSDAQVHWKAAEGTTGFLRRALGALEAKGQHLEARARWAASVADVLDGVPVAVLEEAEGRRELAGVLHALYRLA